ncbi:hypothetical protein NVP1121O_049 [Vibrio phage 1.121.O._10N.286.46.C4]|nr:hypothetical protein NVP1121O_049 [Vibrio phage 1.121.O._10N.286.46.C4]
MAYNLPPKPFNDLQQLRLTAESLGELVPDMLGSLRSLTSPVSPDIGTLGTATTYTMDIPTQSLGTPSTHTYNFTYTSDGTETMAELIEAIVTQGRIISGALLSWEANTDYVRDEDMYFTVVSREGIRVSGTVVYGNLQKDLSMKVQGSIGKPCAFTNFQSVLEQDYPRLVVSKLPVITVCEKWDTGSVLTDGVYRPYYDSYLKLNYQVMVESGAYDDIFRENRAGSETILRSIIDQLKDENTFKEFCEKIGGTINRDFTITPLPRLSSVEYVDGGMMNMTIDFISRYVDLRGHVISRVEIEPTSTVKIETLDGTEIPSGQDIERPDHDTLG